MSRPTQTAAPRGGFSALAALQPLFATLARRDGVEILGAAYRTYLIRMSGCELPGAPRAQAIADTVAEMGIVNAIAALHGTPMGPDDGTLMGPDDGTLMGPDDGTPMGLPFNPLEGKKIPSSSPLNDRRKEGIVSPSAPSFEEWAEQAKAIGWEDSHAVRQSYDWRTSQGWESVQSWRRLCSCLANNWKSKAVKSARLDGAFAQKGAN